MISFIVEILPEIDTPLIFWIQVTELVRNLTLAVAGIVASWVGVIGLKSWKELKKWERKLTVADEILGNLHLYVSLISEVIKLVDKRKQSSSLPDRTVRDKRFAETDIQFLEIQKGLGEARLTMQKNFKQAKILFSADVASLMSKATKQLLENFISIDGSVRENEKITTSYEDILETTVETEFLILAELYGKT